MAGASGATPVLSLELLAETIKKVERALAARIALAEAEIIHVRDRPSTSPGAPVKKSSMLDARKLYPKNLTGMARWKKWSEKCLRWVRLEDKELHKVLLEAGKSRKAPIVHTLTSRLSSGPTLTTGCRTPRRTASCSMSRATTA